MSTQQSDLARLLRIEGNVRVDAIESDALQKNPLADPSSRPVIVYTPPRYDEQASRRYPVLYCLHGYTGDAAALVSSRPWETNVVQWMDRLITAGEMPDALLVIVDGFTRLGGSQYVNSVHNGGYATYVVSEIVGHVDRSYRTIPNEGGRAVFGKSSGGFGALYLSMEYPGVFAAFASHSGDSYFRYAHTRSFPTLARTLERFGWDIRAFVEHFERQNKRPQHEYETMEMLGYAAAYSPRSATAFDLDLPVDRRTGALDDAVFARWLAFDPVEMMAQRHAELSRLRLRYIDCGRRDEYGLDIGARLMAQQLSEWGLPVQHEEFDDDHRNVGYRYARSLPALARVLEKS
ncbi:MAG: esterase family protein [Candidatus Eremiobacteraeota bacterium]|nr:esterase family protein [Candidatus Eremiobacteraeota bacterium]